MTTATTSVEPNAEAVVVVMQGYLKKKSPKALGKGKVVVGHDHHRQPGIVNIGVGKTGEQARNQRTLRLHLRHPLLQLPVW